MTNNEGVIKVFTVKLQKVLFNKKLFIKAEIYINLGGKHCLGYTLIPDGTDAKTNLLQIIENEERDVDWSWDTYSCPRFIDYYVQDKKFDNLDNAWSYAWNNTQSVTE